MMLPQQAYAADLRRRLFNPPNGRVSTEVEVVSEAEQRRRAFVEATRKEQEKAARLALQAHRRQQLAEAFCAAHRRSGFWWRPFMVEDGVPVITFEQIMRTVCTYFQVPRLHVLSRSHGRRETGPRQIVMYLAREHTSLTFPGIGRLLSNRDHTTILHGHALIKRRLEAGESGLCAEVSAIKRRLGISEDRSAA